MARGRSRSLGPWTVLEEVEALAARGFQEVVLTGVHLGGYGEDLRPQTTLPWLIDAMAEQGVMPRLRLSSIDPHEITEDLVRRVAALPGVCPHFHVPLQAGDDGVLARMRRRYDTVLAAERLAMIRDLLPMAGIGTDLIAGFPGESDAAFERTVAFVERSPITYAHVFPYSVRSGTTAAKLDGRVAPPVIRARSKALRRVVEAKRAAFRRSVDGTEAEVLVEHQRDRTTGLLRGYTEHYVRVHLDGDDDLMGTRRRVRLDVQSQGVRGTLVP
jgi:threonylcarbamoyladenosine tRNA methylthiotransferase MtaB